MVTEVLQPEAQLALAYTPRARRDGLAALLALDATLAAVLRTTREPMVGQMRLTWWHDALTRLDAGPPPAEPVLAALTQHVLPHDVTGTELAGLVEGWEALLEDDPLPDAALQAFAAGRGGRLFVLGGRVLGSDFAGLQPAGEAWALADLTAHSRDAALATRARAAAAERSVPGGWPRAARPLGVLLRLVRDADAPPFKRLRGVLWHRLTGSV
jgi:15-cis-phytoene synthase